MRQWIKNQIERWKAKRMKCQWMEAPPESGVTGTAWTCFCVVKPKSGEPRCEEHGVVCPDCNHCGGNHDYIRMNVDDAADELAKTLFLTYPVQVCRDLVSCLRLPDGIVSAAVCKRCIVETIPTREQARVRLN